MKVRTRKIFDLSTRDFLSESYAPFLSLANRGEVFANDDNPGPGHYDIRNALSSNVKVSDSQAFIFKQFSMSDA